MKGRKKEGKTFRQAIESTPDTASCFRQGLTALGPYRNRIEVGNTRQLEGSLDIDACTTALYPQSNRWDYVFGYKGEAYFVEVHSANSGEVRTVLRKLQWLKDWLHEKAPEINRLKAKSRPPFYWIQSKGFAIPKTSHQFRAAEREGLKPIAKLQLP